MRYSPVRIAIAGATGAVGKELLRLMEERNVDAELAGVAASSRSAGQEVRCRGESLRVADLEHFDFSKVDLAFFSAGSAVSRVHARRAAAQGALVIDNTNAFRMDDDTPLVVPQVNARRLATRPQSNIIANPNCSTIPVVRLLDPVHKVNPVLKVIASTYQAASGAGLTGLDELDESIKEVLDDSPGQPVHRRFVAPLGFNVVPSIDVLEEDGFTLEERKMVQETRKILDAPAIHLSATCVRVPVRNCHSAAVYVECGGPLDLADLKRLWRDAPEIQVYDGVDAADFPSPRVIGSSDLVHVGRIRRDPENPNAFWFWVVSDNIRIGAALNAVQIAETLISQQRFDIRNPSRLISV
ncbi:MULTISPECIES: aspartate-semialdehyde dehydrogenase [unclassified Caballeronia]|uniref:aspartate-semialdehyde dehydrogenase n=1 Tax=unclassified Caballeronia TaxID=2646786 RepID=UPI0019D2E19B|nr:MULTISPECIES: aspartate-semialdehyde dehydrogenase [unclassified Caballeronia]QSN61124.1 aspartate-semialdehyde dehydrogenase [Caballeronia sp. M1242]